MIVLSSTKYKRISAAMLSAIVFAGFSIVAMCCSLPAVSEAQGLVQQIGQNSVDSCPVTKQAQPADHSACCCSLTAVVKADTPKLPKVAILIYLSVDPGFVDPVIISEPNPDPWQLSSVKSSLPIYLATQRLRI